MYPSVFNDLADSLCQRATQREREREEEEEEESLSKRERERERKIDEMRTISCYCVRGGNNKEKGERANEL